MQVVYSECVLKVEESVQFSLFMAVDQGVQQAPVSFRKSMQLDFCCDASIVFNRNRKADEHTRKQRKLSIKRTGKSERDKFSKQRPKHVT